MQRRRETCPAPSLKRKDHPRAWDGARGSDPRTSVLNEYCQAHVVSNLFVTDAACFVSTLTAAYLSPGYSHRNACTGSMEAARRAGRRLAASDVSASTNATAAKVATSHAGTANKSLRMNNDVPIEQTNPMANPAEVNSTACPMTSLYTPLR